MPFSASEKVVVPEPGSRESFIDIVYHFSPRAVKRNRTHRAAGQTARAARGRDEGIAG